MCAHTKQCFKVHKADMDRTKEKSTFIVVDFNILLTVIDITNRPLKLVKIKELNTTFKQLDIIDIYKILLPKPGKTH